MPPAPLITAPAADAAPPVVPAIDPAGLDRATLLTMAAAGRVCLDCEQMVARRQDTLITELLRREDSFYEWQHYPDGDVYDGGTHSQYYYHAHPKAERLFDEHGHFHTFLRPLGMPGGVTPAPVSAGGRPPGGNDALSHLVAISMDRSGAAVRLFTVNRWVTGETWYAATDVIRMLDRFAIGHAQPSGPVNRWITHLVRLFKPDIAALLRCRDATVAVWARCRAAGTVFDDRALDVTSVMDISIPQRLAAVDAALLARDGAAAAGDR